MSFRQLQAALLEGEEAAAVTAATSIKYHSFVDVPSLAFPLFLSSKQYLQMLDASCKGKHFFPRGQDGAVVVGTGPGGAGWGDGDGIEEEIELNNWGMLVRQAEAEALEAKKMEGGMVGGGQGEEVRGRSRHMAAAAALRVKREINFEVSRAETR